MIRRYERQWFWIIAIVMLAIGIGLRDPWPADEPRFVLVAKQMVESGNWLFPMRGDELYPDKPPVFMWILAVFYSITGSVKWSFLIPSLLSGLGVLWLVRDLGERLWPGENAGEYASWMTLFTLMFTYQFKRAQIDPLLTFELTLAAWAFLRHFCEKPNLKLWCLGFFMAGLGVITKGVGIIVLFMLIPVLYAMVRGWNHIKPNETLRWSSLLGLVFLLLPILAWLLPMVWSVDQSNNPAYQAYADNILLKQTAKRYANPWGHNQPWYYFIEVIVLQWLPATLLLPFVIKPWREALQRKDSRILILLGWVVLTVIFFSISRGKREVYIMPVLPMFCLAMGPYIGELITRRSVQRVLTGFNLLLILGLIVAGGMLTFGDPKFAAKIGDGAQSVGLMVLVVGVLSLLIALWRYNQAVLGVLATLFLLWCGLSLVAYPVLNDDSSAKELMDHTGEIIGPGGELALVQWKEQNLLMADRPAKTFGFLTGSLTQWNAAQQWASEKPNRWILSEDIALPKCFNAASAMNMGVYNRRTWLLIRGNEMCPATADELANDFVKEKPGTQD